MNDRQRLEAIINVIGQYLPPDGIPVNDAMSEIILLVDPLPPQRTWVHATTWRGLTDEEIGRLDLSAVTVKDAISDVRAIEAKLREKNCG